MSRTASPASLSASEKAAMDIGIVRGSLMFDPCASPRRRILGGEQRLIRQRSSRWWPSRAAQRCGLQTMRKTEPAYSCPSVIRTLQDCWLHICNLSILSQYPVCEDRWSLHYPWNDKWPPGQASRCRRSSSVETQGQRWRVGRTRCGGSPGREVQVRQQKYLGTNLASSLHNWQPFTAVPTAHTCVPVSASHQ